MARSKKGRTQTRGIHPRSGFGRTDQFALLRYTTRGTTMSNFQTMVLFGFSFVILMLINLVPTNSLNGFEKVSLCFNFFGLVAFWILSLCEKKSECAK